MTQVNATLTGGVFRPDEAVPLEDQTRVRLTIELIAERRGAAALEALLERLRLHPINSGGVRFTRDELHERR